MIPHAHFPKSASLRAAALATLALATATLVAQSTTSGVSADGNFVVNGEAVFPVGFYTENLPSGEVPEVASILAAGGFNFAFRESRDGNFAQHEAFLTECETAGIDVVFGLPSAFNAGRFQGDIRRSIDFLDDFPATAAYNLLDDANNFTEEEAAFQRRFFDSISPQLAKSSSFYLDDARVSEQLPFLELAYMQLYSWDDDQIYGQPLDMAGDFDKFSGLVAKTEAEGVVPIATPQAFNWRGGGTIPPPGHLDAQSYLSIVAGAKGLLFYTLRDYMGVDPIVAAQQGQAPVTLDVTQPRLYGETTNLAAELVETELSRAILSGTRTTVELTPYSYYATFVLPGGGPSFLVAVNVDYEEALPFSIPLPTGFAGIAPEYATRADPLTASGGVASGTLQPLQAVVYRLTSAPVPVDLVAFDARRSTSSTSEVIVTWETATESGVDFFAVEYGAEATDLTEVARATATGSGSAYRVTHQLPDQQTGYYRLRVVDLDGGISYGPFVFVDAGVSDLDEAGEEPALRASPTPAAETLTLSRIPAGTRAWSITAVTGREVASGTLGNLPVAGPIGIDVRGLATGVYFLSVSGGRAVRTVRFAKAE